MGTHELSEIQIDFAQSCASKWIRIYNKHLKRYPNEHDADHSSLLRRLLSGKEALDKPPPLRHSYPDYDLAEGEEVEIMEVNDFIFHPTSFPFDTTEANAEFADYKNGYTVGIDQHIGWKWIKKCGTLDEKGRPNFGLLEYKDGTQYKFYHKVITRKRLNKVDLKTVETVSENAMFLQKVKEQRDGGTD
jgi:hypothetical protein